MESSSIFRLRELGSERCKPVWSISSTLFSVFFFSTQGPRKFINYFFFNIYHLCYYYCDYLVALSNSFLLGLNKWHFKCFIIFGLNPILVFYTRSYRVIVGIISILHMLSITLITHSVSILLYFIFL